MPRSAYRGRGRVLRYRTIVPKPGRYIHVAVVSKRGPRGGRTIAGRVHYKKGYKPRRRKSRRARRSRRRR
jgi:hypothetical protein